MNEYMKEDIRALIGQKITTEQVIDQDLKEILAIGEEIMNDIKTMDTKKINDINKKLNTLYKQASSWIKKALLDTLQLAREGQKKITITDNIAWELIKNETTTIMFDELQKLKIQELKELESFSQKKKVLYIIGHIIGRIIKKRSISWQLEPEDIDEIQRELKKIFPKLGNNQFRKIGKDDAQIQAKINLYPVINDTLIEHIDNNYKEFDNITILLHNMCVRIDDILDNNFTKNYKAALFLYGKEELGKSQNRKFGNKTKEKQKTDEKIEKETDKNIKKIFENNLEDNTIKYIKKITAHIPKADEAGEYMLRLIRNNKEIRINNIVEKFNIDKEIFTERLITEAKKLDIHFTKNGDTPITKDSKPKETNWKQKDANFQKGNGKPKEKTKKEHLLEKVENNINKKTIFTAYECIEIFEMAWYTVTNKKQFTKRYNKLYPWQANQKQFADELKMKICEISPWINQKNKKEYRTIDLKWDNRILFFEKNIIDGIYDHNEYMRRLRNQK